MAKRLPPSLRNFKPTPAPKSVDTFGLIDLAKEHRQPPPPGGGYMLAAVNATLTSPSATATGATTASLSVSSNIAGTLYWIVSVNATLPTTTQIQTGKDGTGATAAASGNQGMSAGANTSTASGLVSNTTYNAFWTTDRNVSPPTATFATQFDPAVVSWAAQVVTNGGTVSATRKNLVNTMVAGMRADGVWIKLDRLWVLAAENSQSALTDMVADSLATTHGSPTFTTDRGYTGVDGSTTVYIDSGYNPSTSGVTFTQNSAHISAWSTGNTASSVGGCVMGHFDGVATGAHLFDTFTDGFIYARINDSPLSANQGAPGTRAGHWIVNRSGASASQVYQNGSNFSSPNATSGTVVNTNMVILADSTIGGGINSGTPQQMAMVSMGGSLGSTDANNFFTRLRTYMTAVGVP